MNSDDPKLTAYVLGELDEREIAAMEALLKEDSALASEAAALEEFTQWLRKELKAETAPGLTEEQREQVFAAARSSGGGPAPLAPIEDSSPQVIPLRRRVWIPAAIAASLVLASLLAVNLGRRPAPGVSALADASGRVASGKRELRFGIQVAPEEPPQRAPGIEAPLASLPEAQTSVPSQMEAGAAPKAPAARITPPQPAHATDALAVNSPADADKVIREDVERFESALKAMDPQDRRGTEAELPEKFKQAPKLADAEVDSKSERRRSPRSRSMAASELSFGVSAGRETKGTANLALEPEWKWEAIAPPAIAAEAADTAEAADAVAPELAQVGEADQNASKNVPDGFVPVLRDRPIEFPIVPPEGYAGVESLLAASEPKPSADIGAWLNYFTYDYPQPVSKPVTVSLETARCPWAPSHQLVRVALLGRKEQKGRSDFDIAVHGSNELMGRTIEEAVRPEAGDTQKTPEPLGISAAMNPKPAQTVEVLRRTEPAAAKPSAAAPLALPSGVTAPENGPPAGVEALNFAYFSPATPSPNLDGKKELSVKVGRLESDPLRTIRDAVAETGSVAADGVRVTVQFDGDRVLAYRFIGSEANRRVALTIPRQARIGSGQQITGLYEIIPLETAEPGDKRGKDSVLAKRLLRDNDKSEARPLLTLQLQWNGGIQKVEAARTDRSWEKTSDDFRWAAAVAQLGLLWKSESKDNAQWQAALRLGRSAAGSDPSGARKKFLDLISEQITSAK